MWAPYVLLKNLINNFKGATFDASTDSLEALRDFDATIKDETALIKIKTDSIGLATDEGDAATIFSKLYEIFRNKHSIQYTWPFHAAAVALTGHATSWLLSGNKVEIIPAGVYEVNTFEITHECIVSGNLTITLNGVDFIIAVLDTDDTIEKVAAKIRLGTFTDWTVTPAATAFVEFTCDLFGVKTTGTLGVASTEVLGSVVKTATGTGIDDVFSIHHIAVNAAETDTYQIELYKGLGGSEIFIGTARAKKEAVQSSTNPQPMQTERLPAGTRITGDCSSLEGTANVCTIALYYHKH